MDGGMGKRPKGANLVIPEILVIFSESAEYGKSGESGDSGD